MTEEALVDMLLPVKIDPIDRGLPTDVDKARIAAIECRLCGERTAKADGKVELREDGLLVGVQPRYRCGACGGSWREGWA